MNCMNCEHLIDENTRELTIEKEQKINLNIRVLHSLRSTTIISLSLCFFPFCVQIHVHVCFFSIVVTLNALPQYTIILFKGKPWCSCVNWSRVTWSKQQLYHRHGLGRQTRGIQASSKQTAEKDDSRVSGTLNLGTGLKCTFSLSCALFFSFWLVTFIKSEYKSAFLIKYVALSLNSNANPSLPNLHLFHPLLS